MTEQSVKNILNWMEPLSFFNEMTPEERENLALQPQAVLSFEGGRTLAQQGDTDTAFFVVLDGQLSVTRNKPPEVFLAQLVPGSIFGEITLRGDRPRSSSVNADDSVTVLKIDQTMLDQLPSKISSKVKDQIIRILVKRLDEMNNKLVQFIR